MASTRRRRRTFAENLLYEQASRVRRIREPHHLYETNDRELERLSTSRTILNFLRRHKYKVDITE